MSKAIASPDRPWEMPFWKPARGKEFILLYLAMIHALALVGFILFPLPSLPVFLIAIGGVMLGGFGTTVCYHRAISHRAVKLNPVLEQFLIFWTMFNGSGAPASWSAYHRRHHARADAADGGERRGAVPGDLLARVDAVAAGAPQLTRAARSE